MLQRMGCDTHRLLHLLQATCRVASHPHLLCGKTERHIAVLLVPSARKPGPSPVTSCSGNGGSRRREVILCDWNTVVHRNDTISR